MSPYGHFWALTGVVIVVELAADILLKKWAINNQSPLLWTGVLLYCASIYFWAHTLRHRDLIVSYGVYSVLSAVGIALIGHFLFHETLTPRILAGICVGACSIYFLTT